MAALKYWLWLTNLPGLSIRSQWLLLTAFTAPPWTQEEIRSTRLCSVWKTAYSAV